MNLCALSGRLVAAPISVNDGQAIKFLLKTHYPIHRESITIGRETEPCVLFGAKDSQRDMLLGEDYKQFRIELVGRVARSSYENGDGKRIYTTEVIVNPEKILFRRVK